MYEVDEAPLDSDARLLRAVAEQGGFRFPVSGFRFPVSGFRFPVSGFRLRVWGVRSR